jgi:hypothetical protein
MFFLFAFCFAFIHVSRFISRPFGPKCWTKPSIASTIPTDNTEAMDDFDLCGDANSSFDVKSK